MENKFTVEEAHRNLRIDKFLVGQFPDVSRSQLQKWIKAGAVLVNNEQVTKHYALEVGDVVLVTPPTEDEAATKAKKEPVAIEIIHEDDDIIVINKPTGLLVHPANDQDEWTLVSFLLDHFPEITEVGEDPLRPGIVHRLDRDASGIMVAAKTQQAFENIKKQFASRQVDKEYRAIVYGVPSKEHDIIKFKIAHSKTAGGKMAAKPEHEEGKDAWTEFDVLEVFKKRYAMLSVQIRTGRTHQIRAHLAALDHPIIGDRIYKSRRYKQKKGVERMFLHAHELGFRHPKTGEKVSFSTDLPVEFTDFKG